MFEFDFWHIVGSWQVKEKLSSVKQAIKQPPYPCNECYCSQLTKHKKHAVSHRRKYILPWKFLFCCQLASDRPSATVTWQMLAHNRERELFLISLMILTHLTVFYVWTLETPRYLAHSRLFWHCISHQKTYLNCSNFKVNDCKGEIIFPPKAWRVSLCDTNSAWRNLPNESTPLLLRCFLLLRLTFNGALPPPHASECGLDRTLN